MKRYILVVFLFAAAILFVNRVQAQIQFTVPAENDMALSQDTSREGSGNEMGEDVLGREKYYIQRYAYPYGAIPQGAYRKAIEYARTMPRYNAGNASTLKANIWRNVGPINIGGRINAIAVNPLNGNTIYIDAADGGVWKTYDEGMTWFSVFDNAPTQSMGALAIDPLDTNTIYAGTGEANYAGDSFTGMGMFKSTDGGATWNAIGDSTFPQDFAVASIAINPKNPNIVYATVPTLANDTAGGVYESTNAGATWSRIFAGIAHSIIIDPVTPTRLYVAASTLISGLNSPTHGIYSTTNGGATWALDSLPGVSPSTMGRTALGLCAAHPNVIYAGVGQIAGTRARLIGVFRSGNYGVTWTKLPVQIDYLVPQVFYDNILAVSPADSNTVFVAGVRPLYSTDGGETWTYIPEQYYNSGIVHSDHHAAAFNLQHPDTLYDGNDGGFFRGTAKGTSWTKRSFGLAITQFTGGAMYPNNDAMVFGGTQDNGTLQSIGSNVLTETLGGDGGFTAVDQQHPNILYSEQYDLSLYKSTDLGTTWRRTIAGIPADEQTIFYAPYAVDPLNGNRIYYGSYRVWISSDGGNTWNATGCLFQPSIFSGCYFINSISVSPYNDSIVVAGSTNGEVSRTTNFGKAWTVMSAGLPQRYITSVHAAKDNSMYATASGFGSGHVFWYPDTAKKWYDVSGNLPDAPANDVFASGDTLVVGTMIGAYISTDNGAHWAAYGTGMPAVSIEQLLFDPQSQTLRAVTHGRSMFDIAFGSPAQRAPQFLSVPDTAPVDLGEHYVYAPVVNAYPAPVYTVSSLSHTATIDSTLGMVQWIGLETGDTITITARNTAGTATQKFYLPANISVPATDWHIVSAQQTGRKTFAFAYAGAKTLWMTQDSGVVAHSVDGGATWTRSTLAADALGPVTGLYAFDSLTAFVGTWQGNIYETTNGGSSWQLSRADVNARYENVFFTDRQHGMAISAGEKDTALVVVTTNGGATWAVQPSHAFSYLPIAGSLYFLDRNHGWFASSNQLAVPPGAATIFFTTDGGVTWNPEPSDCNFVSSIAFVDTLNGFAVDRFGGVVDKTTDGGRSWKSVNVPPSNHDLCSVKTFPPTSIVWMVSSSNAWVSYNKGNAWTATTLVPSGPISAAAFADTSHGWAAAQNNIVQEHTENPLVFVQEQPLAPDAFTMENYPNPFSRSTNLQFTTAQPLTANASLKIYNEVGECVKDLTPEIARNAEGKISVWFDAGGLPEGIYFAVLQSQQRNQMKALVYVK